MMGIITNKAKNAFAVPRLQGQGAAIKVLEELKMTLPVKSEMFAAVSGLSGKLKNERIDFAYEMKAAAVEIEE